MNQEVEVLVSTRKLTNDHSELILEAMEGASTRWSKVYDGALFLSMDAQSLGLLEPIPDASSGDPKFRLKRSGQVQPEMLHRMRFVRLQEPNDHGQ